MTPADFRDSLAADAPPAHLSSPLQALWWAANGNWDKAHHLVMSDDGAEAAWVHAYLHRVQGDLPNARYWYGAAKKAVEEGPLDAEWHAIVNVLVVNNLR